MERLDTRHICVLITSFISYPIRNCPYMHMYFNIMAIDNTTYCQIQLDDWYWYKELLFPCKHAITDQEWNGIWDHQIGALPVQVNDFWVARNLRKAIPYVDVTKWKHCPRYWPFVRGIRRLPVNSPQKGRLRGALIFPLICVWINDYVNNREAGDWRRHRGHYDVTAMKCLTLISDTGWAIDISKHKENFHITDYLLGESTYRAICSIAWYLTGLLSGLSVQLLLWTRCWTDIVVADGLTRNDARSVLRLPVAFITEPNYNPLYFCSLLVVDFHMGMITSLLNSVRCFWIIAKLLIIHGFG